MEAAMLHRVPRELFVLSVALIAPACYETTHAGVATTTAANITADSAALEVARARCRRAAECNRFGNGHMYADESQCNEAYRELALPMPKACVRVDAMRFGNCVATLRDQSCDADMGPIPAMPDCDDYCAK